MATAFQFQLSASTLYVGNNAFSNINITNDEPFQKNRNTLDQDPILRLRFTTPVTTQLIA
jgi:hypothetical protein